MRIDVSDAKPEKAMPLDQSVNLFVPRYSGAREAPQIAEDRVSPAQIAQRQFSDDEGMGEHLPIMQRGNQARVAMVEMIDPDRGIYQDHVIRICGAGLWRYRARFLPGGRVFARSRAR